MHVARVRPASRKAQELCIDIAAGGARERVILTLSTTGRDGGLRTLETLLTSLEARHLAHAVLDALGGQDREWPVRVQPAYPHDANQYFDVAISDRPQRPVIITLHVSLADAERSLPIQLAHDEARRLGYSLLGAANPSRLASDDD
jgi:hypothetical protein